MATPKNWQELALRKLGEKNQMPAGLAPGKVFSLEDAPNFQVYEFSPNKKLDQIPGQSLNKGKRYLISGAEWSIMQQSSLLKTTHDLLGERLGYNFTFEEWFEYWENGFSFGLNRVGTTGLTTNYPIRKVGETEGWRTDKSTRPGYLEWRNPSPKFQPGFRVIEYWPDRSDTETSYVLSGSDRDIIQQILNIEWGGSGGIALQERDPLETNDISFKGQPMIRLWFRESKADRDPNYQYVLGKLAFRLIGKTERWDLVDAGKTPLQKLTTAELTQIANRIVQEFAVPTPYRWTKGKISAVYQNKSQGISTYSLVHSQAQGLELYQKLFNVIGLTFDDTKLRFSQHVNETGAFPVDPPNMNVLGKTMGGIRKRPYTHVYFTGAVLMVESLSYNISLVKNQTVVFDESKFAQAINSL
ncbi:MAG: hypothetical protein AAFO04_24035 [Cyanobacteria bacterium J06592_8]